MADRPKIQARMRRSTDHDVRIGANVRTWRLVRGMSQERLGEMVGITFQQVQKYEKGVNRISAGRLFEVARVLDVSVSTLFAGLQGADDGGATAAPPVLHERLDLDLAQALARLGKPQRRAVLDLARTMAPGEKVIA